MRKSVLALAVAGVCATACTGNPGSRASARVASPARGASTDVMASVAPRPAPAPTRAVAAPCGAPARPVAGATPRSVNATCPVLVGNPVKPDITTTWNGRTVAFCSTTARLMWEADPSRFSANLPGVSGTSADVARAPAAALAARPAPAATSSTLLPVRRVPATGPIAPAPATGLGGDDEECCPGGVCRIPGR
jgi:hypothetical protein